ncbi:tetratricopeptide repeat protein [Streptomyces sp. NBC_01244]|uniref:tetratricopeptide repeat protein n=1 Tax=Streptomyces sp. NBC_01244 TaxID=2903797 RepID=UPI002E142AFA|nr:tetratricopeptide repeat protein [Streptomyces sp. NBC_01244]
MQRVSKAWRWPLACSGLAAVGALFVPIGGPLWAHLIISLGGISGLVRMAHREIPFAVAVAQWRLGGDDPAVLRARVLSAAACLPRGRGDLAMARLKAVLADLSRVQGPEHPDTLAARCLCLQVRGELGDLPDRIAAMEELVGSLTHVLGPGHPDTVGAWYILGEWFGQDGRDDLAESAYRHVINAGGQELGLEHNLVLMARSSLVILRYEQPGRDKNAALAEMTAVVDGMERVLGSDHPTTAATRRLLTQWKAGGTGAGT